jgi:hypothetical protein
MQRIPYPSGVTERKMAYQGTYTLSKNGKEKVSIKT